MAAYHAALEEWTRERVPLDWATTQNNLGTALATLGERQGDPRYLRAALEAVESAHEVLVIETGHRQYDAYFVDRIDTIRATLSAIEP